MSNIKPREGERLDQERRASHGHFTLPCSPALLCTHTHTYMRGCFLCDVVVATEAADTLTTRRPSQLLSDWQPLRDCLSVCVHVCDSKLLNLQHTSLCRHLRQFRNLLLEFVSVTADTLHPSTLTRVLAAYCATVAVVKEGDTFIYTWQICYLYSWLEAF